MKAYKYLLSGLFLAGLTGAAYAQPSIVPNNDLVLGFAASGGTGAAVNVEVDLGSVGSFVSAGSGTYALGNLNTSLTANYGSNWATRADLYFGVIGATTGSSTGPNGQATDTFWASSAENSGTFPATVWKTKLSANSYVTPNTNVSSIYNGFPNGTLDTSITGTTAFGATLQGISISNSTGGSWTAGGGANTGAVVGQSAFGLTSFGQGTLTFEVATGSGHNLDLIQSVPGANGNGVDLGYFALAGDGGLTFNVTPIPEPSTYAAILGLASLGFVMIRRRRQASAV